MFSLKSKKKNNKSENSVPFTNILYKGICLKRENAIDTIAGDAVITYQGLFYYKRSGFSCKIGKAPCDFFINSKEISYIEISKKNMNNVMELHMVNNSVLEFYSPDFNKMVSAMQQSIKHSKSSQ